MKLKKLLLLGISAIALVGMNTVNADSEHIRYIENTGRYAIAYHTDKNLPSITTGWLTITGVPVVPLAGGGLDHIYIGNGELPPLTEGTRGCTFGSTANVPGSFYEYYIKDLAPTGETGSVYDKEARINVVGDYFMLKGHTQAYVIHTNEGVSPDTPITCTVTPVTITNKMATSALGTRYDTFLFNETSVTRKTISSFSQYPSLETSGTKLGNGIKYVEVGLIEDEDLLYKLVRNKAGSLNELLSYAKTHNGEVIAFDLGATTATVPESFKVVEGAYYYIHTYYNEPLYRDDLEDVIFTKGHNEMIVKFNDYIKDSEVVKGSETITENPKTGVYDYIWVLPIVLVAGSIGYLVIKSKRKFN